MVQEYLQLRKIDIQDDIQSDIRNPLSILDSVKVRKNVNPIRFAIFGQNILPYYIINYNGCVKFISLYILTKLSCYCSHTTILRGVLA